jgi:5-formyltetrahydrofolate cyclo-ligase
MGQDHDEERRGLRARIRAERELLAPELVARLSALACARVCELPCYVSAPRVVAYAATGKEIDPGPVVTAALRSGKAVYFPRMVGQALDFLLAAPDTLRPGRHGLPEPIIGDRLSAGVPGTIFLVPGVAFDERGARLGRGAGCFDRALPRFPEAVRIGLAYEFQVLPLIPEAPWDVRMDTIVTELRVRAWSGVTEVRA